MGKKMQTLSDTAQQKFIIRILSKHSHWPLQVVITQESGGDERRKYLLILEKYVKSYQIIWQSLEWVNNGTNENYIWNIEQESIKYYNSRKSWWPQQQQQQDWWKST